MWLSLLSIFIFIVLCSIFIIATLSWKEAKSAYIELRQDHAELEADEQQALIQIVAFSKLWFRKQFNFIDRELINMSPSLLRTGLIAVREEYEEDELQKTLQWQLKSAIQARKRHINKLELLNTNLLTIAMFVAVMTLIGQLQFMSIEGAELALAPLTTLAFALCVQGFVCKPLIERLYRQMEIHHDALNIHAEGIMMISQGQTPAQIRSVLEAMTNGLDHIKGPAKPANKVAKKPSSFIFTTRKAS
ncbi:hypothetical protein A3715_12195 [Oleiphilus sp. HI0009]|uniref:hypothetical protein n=1 Tax=Oleiphilus sp. HI0125 TaxID=1822266 RepID=UPI0007C2B47D|nr:hypothetical protein [Oleiphilus sp. HI0125]KZX76792.1 hypothetical protein A3715_12195 [Oleiphilus sp. HI0009]KZZ58500.1 hypothetical protein A3762_07815 [Oleiphilus sp. HI0125]